MKMNKRKIYVPCVIKSVAKKEAKDKANKDMEVPDPQPDKGKAIIEDAKNKDGENPDEEC